MPKRQERKTIGFDPHTLSDLLRLAKPQDDGQAPATSEQQRAQMLDDMLAEPLPLGSSAAQMLPGIPAMLTGVLEFCDEKSVGQLLFGSDTSLRQLRQIKDQYRERSRVAQSGHERAAAVAVYYAAIAAALVRHDVRISSYLPQDLAEAFEKLGKKPWAGDGFKKLYEEATQWCRDYLSGKRSEEQKPES